MGSNNNIYEKTICHHDPILCHSLSFYVGQKQFLLELSFLGHIETFLWMCFIFVWSLYLK